MASCASPSCSFFCISLILVISFAEELTHIHFHEDEHQSTANPSSLWEGTKCSGLPPSQRAVLQGIMNIFPQEHSIKVSFLSEEASALYLATFLHTDPLQVIFQIPRLINLIESLPNF